MVRARPLLASVVVAALVACNAILGIDSPNRVGDDDGGSDGSAADGAPSDARNDEGSDAAAGEAAVDAPADTQSDAPRARCPGISGPPALPVALNGRAFCIDTTEVTIGQYQQFLTAKNGDTSGQPRFCAWNDTYASNQPLTNTGLAVTGVDWCDAYAYCAWAGKRLCGRIGVDGGPANYGKSDDPSGQWFFACSHGDDGNHAYPYGEVYNPAACNGGETATAKLAAPETFPLCDGGFPGLFDMSGNAIEWEDGCQYYSADASDLCLLRGGSYKRANGADGELSCTYVVVAARNLQSDDIGFRCCGD